MNRLCRLLSSAACALTLAATPLLSQQDLPPSAPQPTLPPTAKDAAKPSAQEPGAGAQVHTGTSSGLDIDTRLRNLLADHQFLRIQSQLDQLPPAQAQFYRGILANRSNDSKTSIRLLEPLAEQVAASGDKPAEKLLRKALAEDYLRSGDVAKAAAAYQLLATRLDDQLTPDERDEIELPLKLLPLVVSNPPTTADPCEPFELQVSKNPLGLIDIPVWVDARPHSWMLDPTAPFNLIARSLAREVGLKVSSEASTIHTLTGHSMQVHTAVIPRFTIGGRLTLRNMTVFVYEDADYAFPKSGYQVQGVLGYPALVVLGSLTITDYNTVEVQPASQPASLPEADPAHPKANVPPQERAAREASTLAAPQAPSVVQSPPQGVPFFLDGDQIVAALGSVGDERMFVIDAGSQQTYMTSRYYAEHMEEFNGKRQQLFNMPAVTGLPPQPAFVAETVPLEVGANTVHVHFVLVFTQPFRQSALDDLYGVLGVDALDQLKAYTFDYRTMRFSVRPE